MVWWSAGDHLCCTLQLTASIIKLSKVLSLISDLLVILCCSIIPYQATLIPVVNVVPVLVQCSTQTPMATCRALLLQRLIPFGRQLCGYHGSQVE